MKKIAFLLLTFDAWSFIAFPLIALLLRLPGSDWFRIGLTVSVVSVSLLLLWALAAVRHDPFLNDQERERVRESIFIARWFLSIGLDPIQPWLYLRDRVKGRDTRVWLNQRAA